MTQLKRHPDNPILNPNPDHHWEKESAFNGCIALGPDNTYHMVYRALSDQKQQNGVTLNVSSIGYAKSDDGIHFKDQRQIIFPEFDWEIYGCEDPRITYIDGKYFIFYTALSMYPFAPYGIRLAVATTQDFKTFKKHPVTTFNSKAMGLFPEKINGKYAALLTMNTDIPPAKIALALFDKEEDIWSPFYWTDWYENPNTHLLHLLRDIRDQVELGAPPIKTDYGWLFIYSYITNYMSDNKQFGIEAVLLDLNNPTKILGRTRDTLLKPEKDYELHGIVKDVIFPSGALFKNDEFMLYYGAADTRTCVASCKTNDLLDEIRPQKKTGKEIATAQDKKFVKYLSNPIIKPTMELSWQKKGTFNPAIIYLDNKVHIIYRGQSDSGVSVMGYASSRDGLHIDEHLHSPIYTPREEFEIKNESGNSGCEDPRISKIDDRLYMTYTAYDGSSPPRVALTSISIDDFLNKTWNWETPRLISPPGVDDKDACIVKATNSNKYIAFHRLGNVIWLDFLRDLEFPDYKYLSGGIIAQARKDKWDDLKIGIAGPPMETEKGWLLFYHGVSKSNKSYKVGAMLLDLDDPRKILGRTDEPLLEPTEPYETQGQVPNVVFPCGSAIINGVIYLYYGGADSITAVATMHLNTLLDILQNK